MSVVRTPSTAIRCLSCAGLLVCLLLAATAPPLAAQEPGASPPPQMILVHAEVVKPPMLEQYVEATKAFGKAVAAHRDAMPTFHAEAFQTDEYEFIFALPLSGFAQMDTLMGEFMAMEEAGGEEWQSLVKRGYAATERTDEYVILLRPDLSHLPAEPRVAPDQAAVYRWDFYYLQPDMTREAEALARDIAALNREKGIRDAYLVFQAVLGSDLPYLIVSIPGKSPADIETRLAEVEAAFGEAWAPLQERLHDVTRAFVSKLARPRPDLSVVPPGPADEE